MLICQHNGMKHNVAIFNTSVSFTNIDVLGPNMLTCHHNDIQQKASKFKTSVS